MIRTSVAAVLLAAFVVLGLFSAAPSLGGAASGGHHAVRALALCGGGMSSGSDTC